MTHRVNGIHMNAGPSLALFSLFLVLSGSILISRNSESAAGDDDGEVVMVELSIADRNGISSGSAEIGSELSILSKLRSNKEWEGSIVHIVQIKDSGDRVVFLSVTPSTLESDDEKMMQTSWRPEEEGEHVVQVFLWDDTEPPVPIWHSATQIDIYSSQEIRCRGSASCIEGVVTRIIDGDTMDVNNIRIRLALVDTPEIGKSGYKEATLFTAETCPVGSRVLVDEDDGQTSGSYGRQIAKVFCGNQLINEELLDSGHAVILLIYCDESEFSSEEWARSYGC